MSKHLYGAQRIKDIEDAIGQLEGQVFGRWLKFAALGYDDELHIALDGWKPIRGFRELPDLRGFADRLNAAMAPVIEDYCHTLRQELANRAVKLAGAALVKKDERP